MRSLDLATEEERGVSEVLGYSLIFGIILVSITALSVVGIDSLRSVRDAEQHNNAHRAFEVLADNTADIYQQGAPSRATEFSVVGATLFTGNNSTITFLDPSGDPLESITITPLVFRGGNDNRIVYEGGAILGTSRNSGRIHREPPMRWSNSGSSRPILTIVATQSSVGRSVAGSDVIVRMTVRGRSVALDGSQTVGTMRIQSERAELWQRYLQRKGSVSNCNLDTGTTPPTVTCEVLDAPIVTVHRIELELN